MGLQKTRLGKGLEGRGKKDSIYIVVTRHKQQPGNRPHKNTQTTWEKQKDSQQDDTNALVRKQVVWMQHNMQTQQQKMLWSLFH